jgi:hypothetical protein
MGKNTFFCFVLSFLIFFGCKGLDESQITGEWQATKVLDNNRIASVDLSNTNLSFLENRQFDYQASAFEKYRGSYQLRKDLLILSSQEPVDTFRCQIIELDEDEITLRMNHEGVERKVVFSRS